MPVANPAIEKDWAVIRKELFTPEEIAESDARDAKIIRQIEGKIDQKDE